MRARSTAVLPVVHERRIQLVVQRVGACVLLLAKCNGVAHVHIERIGRSLHGHLADARVAVRRSFVHQIVLEVRGNAIRRGGVLMRVQRVLHLIFTKHIVDMRVHACRRDRRAGISIDVGRVLRRANNKIKALALGLLVSTLLRNSQVVERTLGVRISL